MYRKFLLTFFLIFIVLILAAALIAPRLINTEKIKNKVIGIVREKYNYEVVIDSLRFSFLPMLKLRGEGIGVSSISKAGYGVDVKANAFEASIKLIPLFHRKVEIGKILIDEPVVTLEGKKAEPPPAGEIKEPSPITPGVPPKKKQPESISQKSPFQSVSIAGLAVRKGRIKVKSATLLPERISEAELSDISLSAAPLALDSPIRIKLQSKLAVNKADGESVFLKPVKISLDEVIKIDSRNINLEKLMLDIESISISLSGTFSNIKEPIIDAKLSTGEINLGSLKDFMNFTSGQSASGHLSFEGELSGPLDRYSQDNLKGKLELKEAQFNGLIPNASLKMSGRLDLASSSILKEVLSGNLSAAEIKGSLLLSNGIFNKMAFQALSSNLNYADNIVNLSPIKFSLYDGAFNGNITASFKEEPAFSFKGELRGLSVEKFLADTSTMKDTIYGRLNSAMEVKGKGKDSSRITRTMTGNMHVEMKDGKITTLNLLKAVLSVAGLLSGVRPPEGDYTQVETLTADAVIGEGKAVTDNLRLSSKGLEVVGKGEFTFDQKLDFIMDAYVGTPREGYGGGGGFIAKYMKDEYGRLVVPIRVTGTINKPHVSLDTKRLATDILDQELKKLLPKIFK